MSSRVVRRETDWLGAAPATDCAREGNWNEASCDGGCGGAAGWWPLVLRPKAAREAETAPPLEGAGAADMAGDEALAPPWKNSAARDDGGGAVAE